MKSMLEEDGMSKHRNFVEGALLRQRLLREASLSLSPTSSPVPLSHIRVSKTSAFFLALPHFAVNIKHHHLTGTLSVSWDFDSSAEAWARASSVEMDAEVQWKPSGTIRGTVRGPSPHVDSPIFRVLATDRHHVVLRMRSSGAGELCF